MTLVLTNIYLEVKYLHIFTLLTLPATSPGSSQLPVIQINEVMKRKSEPVIALKKSCRPKNKCHSYDFSDNLNKEVHIKFRTY